jgi:hypothetical protein
MPFQTGLEAPFQTLDVSPGIGMHSILNARAFGCKAFTAGKHLLHSEELVQAGKQFN